MSIRLNRSNQSKNYSLYAFLFAFIISCAVVIPVMIYDNGYFLYYGDFNVQQIPFYQLAHDAVLSGNFKWSSLTDLGSNFVGSYSFYLLGSPFFLISLLFPSEMVPYLFGPMLVLKLSLCSLTGYIYLRRYVRDKQFAVIGGLVYAFSGFSVYNIFFFHFHEAMIIFPLLLAAVDEFMNTKRRGVVALSVFASCVLNYYFFFGQVVFVAIYWFIKVFSKSYKFRIKEFLILFFECIVGVLMACALLLPSVLAIIGNERVSELLTGFNALLYSNTQRYLHILSSLFFPPDIPARANFTPDSNSNWSSIAFWLPLFSMTLVIGFLQAYKKSWLKKIIIISFVMAAVPLLNSIFQALNSCYYARWLYMPTLMMTLCTVYSLENIREIDIKRALKWTLLLSLSICLPIGLMVKEKYSSGDTTLYEFGLEGYKDRFWIYVGISLFCIALLAIIIKFYKYRRTALIKAISLSLIVVCVGYSSYIIWLGKSETDQSDEYTIDCALNADEITLDNIDNVRCDFYNAMDNLGMYWGVQNIQAFHSIVPGSLMDFYNTIGVTRDVASRPDTDFYGVRSLLSCRYLFDPIDDDSFENDKGGTKMPAYKMIGTVNGALIYENKNYIPMGFMYDEFLSDEEFRNLSDEVKHQALLKAMVLSQEQMKKYRDITGYDDGMYIHLNLQHSEDHLQNVAYPSYDDFTSITDGFIYDEKAFSSDCENRAKRSCSQFSYNNNGFTATITNSGDDNLLFFSVPYDEGFTAYVNSEKVEIEKVNIGFMAVKIDGHKTSHIEFRYETPGLRLGIIISVVGFALFAVYLIFSKGFRQKEKFRRKYTFTKQ